MPRRRLEAAIAALNARNDRPYRVAVSVGHADLDPAVDDFESALARADTAMYAHKQRNKQRI